MSDENNRISNLGQLTTHEVMLWTWSLPRLLTSHNRLRSFGFKPGRKYKLEGVWERFGIAFITAGSGMLQTHDDTWEVQAPCLIFSSPGAYSLSQPRGAWDEFFFTYMPDEKLFPKNVLAEVAGPVISFTNGNFLFDHAQKIFALIPQIMVPGVADRLDLFAESLLLDGLISRHERHEREAPDTKSQVHSVHAIRDFIDRHFTAQVNFDGLAAEHGMSPRHCRRLWKRAFGLTPVEYIQDRRMAQARYLLENSDLRIKQIAAALGYQDQYYFSRQFASLTGCSPARYRQATSTGQHDAAPA